MPKQIFQRPVPIRQDHWSKPGKGGPLGPRKPKPGAPGKGTGAKLTTARPVKPAR